MALSRDTNFVAGTKILSAAVNREFNNYLLYINSLIHKDGSVAMEADLELNYATPSVVWDGAEGAAVKWRIRENAGAFQFQYDSAGWSSLLTLSSATGLLTSNIEMVANTPYISWEGTEANAEEWKIEEDGGDLVVYVDDGGWNEVMRFDEVTESVETTNGLSVGTDLAVGNDGNIGNDLTVVGTLTVGALGSDLVGFDVMNYHLAETISPTGMSGGGSITRRNTYVAGNHPGAEPFVVVYTLSGSSGAELDMTKGTFLAGTAMQSQVVINYNAQVTGIVLSIYHLQV